MGSVVYIDFVLTYPEMISSLIAAAPWIRGYDSPNVEELALVFELQGNSLLFWNYNCMIFFYTIQNNLNFDFFYSRQVAKCSNYQDSMNFIETLNHN